jgi:hypothetical protein
MAQVNLPFDSVYFLLLNFAFFPGYPQPIHRYSQLIHPLFSIFCDAFIGSGIQQGLYNIYLCGKNKNLEFKFLSGKKCYFVLISWKIVSNP